MNAALRLHKLENTARTAEYRLTATHHQSALTFPSHSPGQSFQGTKALRFVPPPASQTPSASAKTSATGRTRLRFEMRYKITVVRASHSPQSRQDIVQISQVQLLS